MLHHIRAIGIGLICFVSVIVAQSDASNSVRYTVTATCQTPRLVTGQHIKWHWGESPWTGNTPYWFQVPHYGRTQTLRVSGKFIAGRLLVWMPCNRARAWGTRNLMITIIKKGGVG